MEFAALRISVCFEDCEAKAAEIRKKGKTKSLMEDFKFLLKRLKETISRMRDMFGFDKNALLELCSNNGWNIKLTFNLNGGE